MTNNPMHPGGQLPKPRATAEPGTVDGIPVEELVRLTREFRARIDNEDRQRITREMVESRRNIQTGAPALLSSFLAGRVDLDSALLARFPGAPLLTSPHFDPPIGRQGGKYGTANYATQDGGAALQIELLGTQGGTQVSFMQGGMFAVRFRLDEITLNKRKRFLNILRRNNVIAFLWTEKRWEADYLIFVVRDGFARIYAFGSDRYEAACRLTPDGLSQLVEWMTGFWSVEEPVSAQPTHDPGSNGSANSKPAADDTPAAPKDIFGDGDDIDIDTEW